MIDSTEQIEPAACAANSDVVKQPKGNREPGWRVITSEQVCQLPEPWRDWLLHQGSLTARLQQRCAGQLSVEVLSQDWRVPLRSEQRHLALEPHQTALVREVVLSGHGHPWVYARSIIPSAAFECALTPGHTLDEQPLGAWLFGEPSMTRGAIEVAEVTADYLGAFQLRSGVGSMWARRSVFCVHDKPLLVTEVFLPSLNELGGDTDQ
ncbi:MAG: chorismate--pyruvate lyase family protein [Cellvibrionales bacterium]|nr:chorismate lyase [Porticoccaceae bacterium]|tara:strand:- start:8795 stop:9418 length:624 start_codon:yes stop_codon:yes gene_type:complete